MSKYEILEAWLPWCELLYICWKTWSYFWILNHQYQVFVQYVPRRWHIMYCSIFFFYRWKCFYFYMTTIFSLDFGFKNLKFFQCVISNSSTIIEVWIFLCHQDTNSVKTLQTNWSVNLDTKNHQSYKYYVSIWLVYIVNLVVCLLPLSLQHSYLAKFNIPVSHV